MKFIEPFYENQNCDEAKLMLQMSESNCHDERGILFIGMERIIIFLLKKSTNQMLYI